MEQRTRRSSTHRYYKLLNYFATGLRSSLLSFLPVFLRSLRWSLIGRRCVSDLVAEAHASDINPFNSSKLRRNQRWNFSRGICVLHHRYLSLFFHRFSSSSAHGVSRSLWRVRWLDFQGSREIKRNAREWRFTFARGVSCLCMINNERALLEKEIPDQGGAGDL